MADHPWWSHAIWVALMALVMGWLARARKSATVAGRAKVLIYPRLTLGIMIACTALFVLFAVVAAVVAKPADWWIPYLLLCFIVPSALMVVETTRVRHELRDEAIGYRGLFMQHDVPWTELVSGYWSPSMKWLVLTTRDDRKLRISGMLNGLDALAVALQETRSPTPHGRSHRAGVGGRARRQVAEHLEVSACNVARNGIEYCRFAAREHATHHSLPLRHGPRRAIRRVRRR